VVKDDGVLFSRNMSDISKLIEDNPQSTFRSLITSNTDDIKNSPPAFLKAGNFTYADGLKRVYCVEDASTIQSLANGLRDGFQNNINLVTQPPNNNTLENSNMSESVIIFQEYSYYGVKGSVRDTTLVPTRDSVSANRYKNQLKEEVQNDDNLKFCYKKFPYLLEVAKSNDHKSVNEEIASMIEKVF
jgi:hypothetical protein